MVKLKSITTNILLVTFVAIILVGSAVFFLAIKEHENLYRQQSLDIVDAISSNLSEDLIPLMADQQDDFELSTLLLRLDRYENVLYAKVLSPKWEVIQSYLGQNHKRNIKKIKQLSVSELEHMGIGVHYLGADIITVNLIGEKQYPMGYLVIAKDYRGPIMESNKTLFYHVLPPAALLLVLSLLFILYRHYNLLSPLATINAFAKKVERTKDYTLRLEELGLYEVKELSLSINRMMNTIDGEIVKNKRSTQKLVEQQNEMEKLANFDNLTGLPNRLCFMEMLKVSLAKAKRDDYQAAIMFIDLDGFKGVNDSYGHHVGDRLLVEVSRRMKTCLRDSDVLSRLGGDEFLVLIPYFVDELLLVSIATRLIDEIKKPFYIQDWEIQIGASIGITKAEDSDFDVSNIIGNADIAMYQSKMGGKGTYTTFAPHMMEDSKRRFEIANSINLSLELNDFHLVYQAKVDKNQNVAGYEVLVRWVHQTLGFISPAEFIPVAEHSGKIAELTRWIIKHTCIELPKLMQTSNHKDFMVSVNLSAHDLEPSLLEFIKSCFKKYNVDASKIEFEVTESAYLENFEKANYFFSEIKAMGCSLALDDFGTGYSSLSYLTQLPIDTLKLDKQFIDTIGKSQRATLITATIIYMAKSLNLKIVAEGVETTEQLHFLLNSNCDFIQGFLFSKPTPIDKLLSQQVKTV